MNTEQIKTAIKEFADAGTINWAFTGGEPLLRRDLGELINFANDKGIRTTITTNGILFKKRLKELRRVDMMNFSLDGPKEIHDKMRGKGTYDKVIEAIKLAKEENFNVSISTVINKDHIKNDFFGIRYLLDLAKKFDLGIKLSPIRDYYKSDTQIQEGLISLDEYPSVLSLVKKFSEREHKLIHFSSEFSSGMYNEVINMCKGKKSKLKCYAGILYCYLSPDGMISPCTIKTNISQDGLKNGFLNAFYNLPSNINCGRLCWLTSRNLLFSLNLSALKNAFLTIK